MCGITGVVARRAPGGVSAAAFDAMVDSMRSRGPDDRGTVELGPSVKVDGRRGADHFVGAVNGGGPRLGIYTARGDIRVDRR